MFSPDYLPPLLAFLFAILATLSKTRDETKCGIRSITKSGWIFAFLSSISLIYGGLAIYQEHHIQNKRAIIGDIARTWTIDGLNLLLRPLCGQHVDLKSSDPITFYHAMRSENNLSSVGKRRTVQRDGSGHRYLLGTSILPNRLFEQPYQRYDYFIEQGERLVLRALDLFGQYLSEDELISVLAVLADDFIADSYRLTGKEAYFDTGLYYEQTTFKNRSYPHPYNLVGFYYFDTVYEGDEAVQGDLEPVRRFLNKAEEATILLLDHSKPRIFAPCSK